MNKLINIKDDLNKYIKSSYEKCINCKACMAHCTMLNEFCSSPKELLKDLSDNKKYNLILPYSCTMCNWCNNICPKGIDFAYIFHKMREDVIKNHPECLKLINYDTVKFHQKVNFSDEFTGSYSPKSTEAKKVFMPGCSLCYYSPKLVMDTYNYLKSSYPNIAMTTKCCGTPSYAMGDTENFKKYFSQLEEDFKKMNACEVITACENCFNALKNNLDSSIKVISLWEVIDKLGVPKSTKNLYSNCNQTFSLHDPCSIRTEYKIHDSVRNILKQLGVKYNEFKHCKKETECCGLGGMVKVTNVSLCAKQNNRRILQCDDDYIISYCESCVESINSSNKNSIHILDLIFNDNTTNNFCFKQDELSLEQKNYNRCELKKLISKQDNCK